MIEIPPLHLVILVLTTIAALIAGWLLRARRSVHEKTAINSGWQQQIEAQRVEHGRLVEQNKALMQQVSQFKASGKDATNRARELSTAHKEALERRDVLQRELKDVRGQLEAALARRRQLESEIDSRGGNERSLAAELQQKDERIARLRRDLDGWQQRLPPLIERFRAKNAEAESLAADLVRARERIDELESLPGSDETRVDPVDPRLLDGALDASNDPDDADRPDDFGQARVNDAPVVGLRDDLKQIKGIGPAIEKTLNELGFFRLHQIADMTDYDIDRVARRLKGFRSRIYREDWIGQARELAARG